MTGRNGLPSLNLSVTHVMHGSSKTKCLCLNMSLPNIALAPEHLAPWTQVMMFSFMHFGHLAKQKGRAVN